MKAWGGGSGSGGVGGGGSGFWRLAMRRFQPLSAFDFRGALLKEIRDALFPLVVTLRDRGGEPLPHIPAGAILLGDARQHSDDRKIRARRIRRDALRQRCFLCQPLPPLRPI